MTWPLWATRAVSWLNTGDNAMWVMLPVLAPLIAVVCIGMAGSGTP